MGELGSEIHCSPLTRRRDRRPGPARSATLLLHRAHDHDELLRDMGADPLRKSGILAPLKELLVPYRASDFRAVV